MCNQSRKKWYCLRCSQRSARRWNLKVHIKRRHNGIGEPIHEEVKNEISSQFFYHNQPYFVNDLSLESSKGKEKERDTIDEIYQMVIEVREKLRKIKEIKSFFNELYSLSSSSQQPIITNLIQTPIIQPIIPPVTTTAPLQQTPPPQPAQSSQEQEQKNEKIINPGTDLFTNLFITSTLIVLEIVRRLRGVGKGGEDSIIIPREPSLPPRMITTASPYEKNNNCKKRGEPNATTENTKEEQKLEEDSHDIEEEHPLSGHNLLIDDDDDDYAIKNNIDHDNISNIDNNYDYSSDISLVIKRDDHGDIYE
jgi:hypothetical protein